VFARATLVGVAFDREGIAIVVVEPLRLLVERRPRLIGKLRRIGVEENTVADIHHKVLLAARHRGTGQSALLVLFGAAGDRERCQDRCNEFGAAKNTDDFHSGALHIPRVRARARRTQLSPVGLAAPSLSEGSVNLDRTLRPTPDPADFPESFCNG